jgi:hypothetical protein
LNLKSIEKRIERIERVLDQRGVMYATVVYADGTTGNVPLADCIELVKDKAVSEINAKDGVRIGNGLLLELLQGLTEREAK